jgi:hypothetical protein
MRHHEGWNVRELKVSTRADARKQAVVGPYFLYFAAMLELCNIATA